MPDLIRRTHRAADGTRSVAVYSPCEQYRYVLSRRWRRDGATIAFIGLNPSTATEVVNDPTVRRCIGFARDWNFGGMIMLNVFALRSTDPRGLTEINDPVGSATNHWLVRQARRVERVVACWGTHARLQDRHDDVLALFRSAKIRLACFGLTKHGYPKHPLYLAGNSRLEKLR